MNTTRHLSRASTRPVIFFLAGLLLLPLSVGAQDDSGADLKPEVQHLLPAASEPPRQLRILSFNVHYAHDVDALVDSIQQAPALKDSDILLLQEIESYPAEGESRTRKLAEALKLNYVYAPARRTEEGDGTHGLAILSRHPLRDVEILPLPQYDLGYNTRRRIAVAATVDVAGRPLRVYNLHLDTRINTADRLQQIRPVVEAAAGPGVEQVIIGGDFNTNPFRWLFHRVPFFRSNQAGAVDDFMQEHGFSAPLAESGSTMNKTLFKARVDAIYTRGLSTRETGVEQAVDTSDHFPVWIEVDWPAAVKQAQKD